MKLHLYRMFCPACGHLGMTIVNRVRQTRHIAWSARVEDGPIESNPDLQGRTYERVTMIACANCGFSLECEIDDGEAVVMIEVVIDQPTYGTRAVLFIKDGSSGPIPF